jgi:hypothetical protein
MLVIAHQRARVSQALGLAGEIFRCSRRLYAAWRERERRIESMQHSVAQTRALVHGMPTAEGQRAKGVGADMSRTDILVVTGSDGADQTLHAGIALRDALEKARCAADAADHCRQPGDRKTGSRARLGKAARRVERAHDELESAFNAWRRISSAGAMPSRNGSVELAQLADALEARFAERLAELHI